MPGYRNRSQVPPDAARASKMAKVFRGCSVRKYRPTPTPDMPAPTTRTSRCSASEGGALICDPRRGSRLTQLQLTPACSGNRSCASTPECFAAALNCRSPDSAASRRRPGVCLRYCLPVPPATCRTSRMLLRSGQTSLPPGIRRSACDRRQQARRSGSRSTVRHTATGSSLASVVTRREEPDESQQGLPARSGLTRRCCVRGSRVQRLLRRTKATLAQDNA